MEIKTIVETLLFIAGRALKIDELLEAFEGVPDGPEVTKPELEAALKELEGEWEGRRCGIILSEVAHGYEFRSTTEYAPWIKSLLRPKPQRLSLSAVETLSLVAYRQPMTRGEIEEVRSVDSGGVLKSLLERRLIRMVGRKEEPGRPMLYATTPEFLELFGLRDLSDMPPLREFEEMIKSQASEEATRETQMSVMDLISPEDAVVAMDDQDRDVLEELDQSMKNLREAERALQPENPPLDEKTI